MFFPRSELQPAIIHAYEYARGQKLGILRLNPIVAERLANDTVKDILHPRHLPMLVRPKPWIDYNVGGYLYNQSSYPAPLPISSKLTSKLPR